MPWQERTSMQARREFVQLATTGEVPIRDLCRRFGISHTTAYRLLGRVAVSGDAGLVDQSRRPRSSPTKTGPEMEAAILAIRDAHPCWGGRKIHHVLRADLGPPVPAPSTITDILRRTGRIIPSPTAPHRWTRFEHAAPNALWQMDFMGPTALRTGTAHLLSLLDDHSRYGLWLEACADQRSLTVKTILIACFRRYGLPERLLTDNGPPWGTSGNGGITTLEAWLLRLGIEVWHGAFYHPQTQGKIERWHRTIQAEVFGPTRPPYASMAGAQTAIERFRQTYNQDRPHAALDHAVPASRYVPSGRAYPEQLPELLYGPDDAVRKVRGQGSISFQNRIWFVSRGLIGDHVGIRPTEEDGVFEVRYAHVVLCTIDCRTVH